MLSFCLVIQLSMRVTPLGLCLMVIVNEKPLNLEKTTFSVISVMLIDLRLKCTVLNQTWRVT